MSSCETSLDCPGLEFCCSNNQCCDDPSTYASIGVGVIIAIVITIFLCIGGCVVAIICCCKRQTSQGYVQSRPVVTTTTHTHIQQPQGAPYVASPYPQQQPVPYGNAPYPIQQPMINPGQTPYPPQQQTLTGAPPPVMPTGPPPSFNQGGYQAPPPTNPNFDPNYPMKPNDCPPPYSG